MTERRLMMYGVSNEGNTSGPIILRNDDVIDYTSYDMIAALHDEGIDSIIINYSNGDLEEYYPYHEPEEESDLDQRVDEIIATAVEVIDKGFKVIRDLITKR